jgi:hypothetical protein
MWLNLWWKKWQERTKLIFNKSDLPRTAVAAANSIMISSFSPQEREELMRVIIFTLIQNGEISCTQILADSLFTRVLSEFNHVLTVPEKLKLISRLKRQTKDICFVHGPLVFITMDNYFKVREWRNDGTISGTL